jgi:hypothetical protein
MQRLPRHLPIKLMLTSVITGVLLFPRLAGADSLGVAAGLGNINSQGATALFLSYQKDAPNLFHRQSLYDLTIASWSGSRHNRALTLARELRWNLSQESYIAGSLGLGLVSRTTDHLGTHGQFITRLALGRQFGDYELAIGETHYSNGKTALQLGWHGPNHGEDFLTLMLTREW